MTNPIIRGTTIRRAAAALGIALAAITLSTTAQADRGDRGHRGKERTVQGPRDTQAQRQRNRGDRSARREVRRDSHARYRGHNRWRHGRKHGHYRQHGRPRRHAGFYPGRIFRSAPYYYGRPAYRPRHNRPAAYRGYRGRDCRVIRHVRYDHYGRKLITKRRVCYGRHGR